MEACYDTLRDCDFGFVHQVLSYVRRHEESLTSSVAQSLNTIPLSNLALLLQYGPTYLTREELGRRLKVQLDEYYRALANGLVNCVDMPLRQAFVSEMVGIEDLPNAVGLNNAAFHAGRLLGPGLAGLLIQWFGTGPV